MEFLAVLTALMLAVVPLVICSVQALNAKKLSQLAILDSTRDFTINSLSYFWQLKLNGTHNMTQKAQYLREAADSHQSLTEILSPDDQTLEVYSDNVKHSTNDERDTHH